KENEPWTPPAEDFYMTDAFTDYAIERLDEHKANYNDEPFFLNLCYTAPHWPLHAPAEDIAKYAGRYQQGWDATRQQRYQRQQQLGIIDTSYQLPPRPVSVEAWAIVKDKATWQRRMEVYAAMIDRMDQNIGKVLAKLEANGQLENTLILFMSDNGASDENVTGRNLNNPDAAIGAKGSYVAYREPWAMVSNTPFRRYKGREFMGGIASPLIAHWPAGIAARGDITQQQAHVIDVMPTFLALAGAEYPTNYGGQKIKSMHGRSLVSHFKQQAPTEERTLYFEFKGSKAVIKGDWKLVNNRETKQWELYNLQSDPTEMNNLFDKHPDKFLELRTMHGQWERGVGVFDIEY
ncbi:MAG: sulfatase-like hydrolase/transferase, partial [Bacteroidota bacterium]